MDTLEFFCPYCQLWIDDGVHRQHHHNDPDEPDERRDWRTRGVSAQCYQCADVVLEASLDDEGWCEDCVKLDEYAAVVAKED